MSQSLSESAIVPGAVFERAGEIREVVGVTSDYVRWRRPGSALTHRMWVSYFRRWIGGGPIPGCLPKKGLPKQK